MHALSSSIAATESTKAFVILRHAASSSFLVCDARSEVLYPSPPPLSTASCSIYPSREFAVANSFCCALGISGNQMEIAWGAGCFRYILNRFPWGFACHSTSVGIRMSRHPFRPLVSGTSVGIRMSRHLFRPFSGTSVGIRMSRHPARTPREARQRGDSRVTAPGS